MCFAADLIVRMWNPETKEIYTKIAGAITIHDYIMTRGEIIDEKYYFDTPEIPRRPISTNYSGMHDHYYILNEDENVICANIDQGIIYTNEGGVIKPDTPLGVAGVKVNLRHIAKSSVNNKLPVDQRGPVKQIMHIGFSEGHFGIYLNNILAESFQL